MSQENEELTLDDAYAEESTEVAEVITKTIETDEVKESEPEKTETEKVEEKPEESTTDSKQDSWQIHAVLDERDKRQARDKEIVELKQEIAEFKKPEEDDISVFEDESGSKEQERQRVELKHANDLLGLSRDFAVDKFGEETVLKAEKWYADEGIKSPYVANLVDSAKLKHHKAIYLMQEDEARQDPETFKAKYEAEVLEKLKSDGWTPPQETETETPITPSLASKRSSGDGSTDAQESFDDILGA